VGTSVENLIYLKALGYYICLQVYRNKNVFNSERSITKIYCGLDDFEKVKAKPNADVLYFQTDIFNDFPLLCARFRQKYVECYTVLDIGSQLRNNCERTS
jgi:hypothetical protein